MSESHINAFRLFLPITLINEDMLFEKKIVGYIHCLRCSINAQHRFEYPRYRSESTPVGRSAPEILASGLQVHLVIAMAL